MGSLAELMTMPKGFKQGPGDTIIGPSGTSYPMDGFLIFVKDLMSDPGKVFDAYRRNQAVQSPSADPNEVISSPTPTVPVQPNPSVLTDDARVQKGVFGGPADNEAERRQLIQELIRQGI